MANPAAASVYGVGTSISNGYPVFATSDGTTLVTPNGMYVWNGTAWVPAGADANGNTQIGIVNVKRVLAFSTTTPLAANGVYTSPTVDGINYKILNYVITSDQAGTSFVQHSDDGVTWYNNTTTAQTLAANAVSSTQTTLCLKYIRIVYTNGATLQGSFKIGAYLSPL